MLDTVFRIQGDATSILPRTVLIELSAVLWTPDGRSGRAGVVHVANSDGVHPRALVLRSRPQTGATIEITVEDGRGRFTIYTGLDNATQTQLHFQVDRDGNLITPPLTRGGGR